MDVFDLLSKEVDPFSNNFSTLANAMYFEQKAIVREQIVEAIGNREIHITGIGSAEFENNNVFMHPGRRWDDLSRVFCSANVNLNATPWPRSCHHRIFQITASRALVVTDWRDDALELYEPDKEVIYYKSLEELPDILDHFKNHPKDKESVVEAGYHRFLACHTVERRMKEFSDKLYDIL